MLGVGAYTVRSMESYGPYAELQFRTAPSLMIIAGSLHVVIGIMGLVLTFFNHKLLLLTVRPPTIPAPTQWRAKKRMYLSQIQTGQIDGAAG